MRAWQREMVQREENEGLSCFPETIVMDDSVRSWRGGCLGDQGMVGGSLREPSWDVGGDAGARAARGRRE